jgi:dihydroorotate dehydrogenase
MAGEPVRTASARPASSTATTVSRWPRDWVWIALLGIGMVIGGCLAWAVAATRVVLPYDEAFVGLSRAELLAVNGRLLAFLAHDRVTLAGTMIAIGAIYAGLAFVPMRRGERWARRVMIASGAFGFASFFLFLGFGYFDPLHALVTVLLLPFFLLGLFGPRTPAATASAPIRAPRQPGWPWGQFLFDAVGAGLLLGGVSLAIIGVTFVFVPEDLVFMGTSRAALEAANPRLVPLTAHDRAGLGGALISNGLGVLLAALWGYRPGERWLWWTLFASGVPGFVAALGTHLAVGYVDPWHLAPALAGALLYLAALVMSAPVLLRVPRVTPGEPSRSTASAGV